MNVPSFNRQRIAWRKLRRVFSNPAGHWIIHYSCESFYEIQDGLSPRIASISVRNLDSGHTVSFSIHQSAEKLGVSSSDIRSKYRIIEAKLLKGFFDFSRNNPDNIYIHWNMRNSNYGFEALEHRYQVLHQDARSLNIRDQQRIDLARLFKDVYGDKYINKPCLQHILSKNQIDLKDFLTGAQEAKRFEEGHFSDLHRSTLRKVDAISEIARRSHEHKLLVNTPSILLHTAIFVSVWQYFVENKTITFLGSVCSIFAVTKFGC